MDYALDSIKSYFIDDTIIITESDYLDTAKLYIVKYRRIIAVILLIILVITINYDSKTEVYNVRKHNIMHGGGNEAPPSGTPSGTPPQSGEPASGAPDGGTPAGPAGPAKPQGRLSRLKSAAGSKIREKAAATGAKLAAVDYNALSKKPYDLSARAVGKFKEGAPWLYQILYTIAFTLILAILVLPSFCFFIIGILCFFLLKSKVKALKGL
uniref:Uncharacterized protein n=1 Tax=viral metagenome TaxID=1070528 RepID=A0A6C0HMN6_9ZZZZ